MICNSLPENKPYSCIPEKGKTWNLGISSKTVWTYRRRVMDKLGVRRLHQLMNIPLSRPRVFHALPGVWQTFRDMK
ncbi:TPA: helix-turn-helix transcriptional regulator [Escherichia coli]